MTVIWPCYCTLSRMLSFSLSADFCKGKLICHSITAETWYDTSMNMHKRCTQEEHYARESWEWYVSYSHSGLWQLKTLKCVLGQAWNLDIVNSRYHEILTCLALDINLRQQCCAHQYFFSPQSEYIKTPLHNPKNTTQPPRAAFNPQMQTPSTSSTSSTSASSRAFPF